MAWTCASRTRYFGSRNFEEQNWMDTWMDTSIRDYSLRVLHFFYVLHGSSFSLIVGWCDCDWPKGRGAQAGSPGGKSTIDLGL